MENNPSSQDDSSYDRDDDSGQFNAYEIRNRRNYETDGTNDEFKAAAIAARSGNIALEGFLDEKPDDSEEEQDNDE